MTLKVYGHLYPSAEAALTDALDYRALIGHEDTIGWSTTGLADHLFTSTREAFEIGRALGETAAEQGRARAA